MAVVTQTTIGISLLRALLFPILFIAPGQLALRSALWAARLRDTLSRLQKVVYSVALSTVSVFVLYLGLSLLRWDVLSPGDSIPFWTFVVSVPVHFILTAVIGVITGAFIHNYVETGRGLDEIDNWEFALSRYDDDEVIVRTCGGKEVRGEVVDTAVFDREEGLKASQSNTSRLDTNGLNTSEGILLTDPSATDSEAEKGVEQMYDQEEVEGDEKEEDKKQEATTDRMSGDTEPLYLSDNDTNYAYFSRDDVEGILFLDKLTEEKNPRVSRDDRAQEFLDDVTSELAPQRLIPDISTWIRMCLYRAVLVVTLVVSALLPDGVFWSISQSLLGFNQTVVLLKALFITFSAILLIDTVDPIRQKQWLTSALLLGSFAVPAALSEVLFSLPNSLSLLSGATLGLLLSPTCIYTAQQYGWRPAAYTTLAVFSVTALSHTLQFGVWPQVTEQLSAIGVVFWMSALLVNRLRVGNGSGFDDTAEVTADGVVWLLVTLVSAGVAIPSRIPYTAATTVYKFGSLLVGVVLGSFLVWRVIGE